MSISHSQKFFPAKIKFS